MAEGVMAVLLTLVPTYEFFFFFNTDLVFWKIFVSQTLLYMKICF